MLTTIDVNVCGSLMSVSVVRLHEAPARSPAVVLCHHREGIDEFTLDAARRLAAFGFVVAVPNFYHRRPPEEDWTVSRKTLQDSQIVADVKATFNLLMLQQYVRTDAIGIVGHCMGGRTAFLGAAMIPQFKVAIILYGGHIFKTEGEGMPAPIEFTKDIRATVLALYGANDHLIGREEIGSLERELKRYNIAHKFHVYENAGHAFQDFSRPALYCENASADSWTKIEAFLKRFFL